jgi:hypothetical protein
MLQRWRRTRELILVLHGDAAVAMQVVTDIADQTIGIRSLDWDRDRFDIEFG